MEHGLQFCKRLQLAANQAPALSFNKWSLSVLQVPGTRQGVWGWGVNGKQKRHGAGPHKLLIW